MALPHPGMDAVPFTPLTAEFLDSMIENIESLSSGTGFENGAITTNSIANAAITSPKIDFTTFPTDTDWDSGWITPSFQNGYSAANGTTVSYRKVGGIVYLRGQVGKSTMDNLTMFTLPAGYRPAFTRIYTVPGSAGYHAKFVINADGTVYQVGITGGTYIGIDAANFIAG